ncbi:uncharacterized protein EV420DRAFT_1645831 [Desarmillaria tabescens]|uniref:Uncharacterized protein n=1 Tax=Armillaria tabescens TaxID=1929756 RepID=A0AA39MZS2_ARMTA|nr:uncharacterized protein EV420DRAFT_1645831 [Desarmillaria tabescens]KAK0452193.1 hypothetical protein EV420DRAFT_1645831 [Desarmillaria tabescens]
MTSLRHPPHAIALPSLAFSLKHIPQTDPLTTHPRSTAERQALSLDRVLNVHAYTQLVGCTTCGHCRGVFQADLHPAHHLSACVLFHRGKAAGPSVYPPGDDGYLSIEDDDTDDELLVLQETGNPSLAATCRCILICAYESILFISTAICEPQEFEISMTDEVTEPSKRIDETDVSYRGRAGKSRQGNAVFLRVFLPRVRYGEPIVVIIEEAESDISAPGLSHHRQAAWLLIRNQPALPKVGIPVWVSEKEHEGKVKTRSSGYSWFLVEFPFVTSLRRYKVLSYLTFSGRGLSRQSVGTRMYTESPCKTEDISEVNVVVILYVSISLNASPAYLLWSRQITLETLFELTRPLHIFTLLGNEEYTPTQGTRAYALLVGRTMRGNTWIVYQAYLNPAQHVIDRELPDRGKILFARSASYLVIRATMGMEDRCYALEDMDFDDGGDNETVKRLNEQCKTICIDDGAFVLSDVGETKFL